MAIKKKKVVPKKSKGGRKIVQAKKVTIDGIQFQSNLEATMYKLLVEAGIEFGYETISYIILEPFTYSSSVWERVRRTSKKMIERKAVRKISYTPDFVGRSEEWVIECKGRANESFPLRWKLFKTKMEQREKPPILFMPKTKIDCQQVVEILKEKGYGKK